MSDGAARPRKFRSPTEERLHAWLYADHTVGARVVRLSVFFAPLVLAVAAGFSVCPSAAVGIPCPGCGLTRASLALMTGDVARATALQPLALVVCPLLVGALLVAIVRYVAKGKVEPDRWYAGWVLVGSMTALTVVWVLRFFGYFGGPVPV